MGESALALRISALNGEVRNTGWMAARCSPRASAVCRRASASSAAARSSRSLADSCPGSITNMRRDPTIGCTPLCWAHKVGPNYLLTVSDYRLPIDTFRV